MWIIIWNVLLLVVNIIVITTSNNRFGKTIGSVGAFLCLILIVVNTMKMTGKLI